ncbi:hypothetical protein K1F50_19110 [Muricauda oceani]|jgi:tetratricopeptide (TPR) repeat protein|uniref:Uncharacterized protein n=2 Tax=Flagellimonas TaxID=444459 RepID=A0A6G7IZ42_9FLAO|nr:MULTISPECIES: hypothetical protein [Allomuricauda]MBW8244924.1 hypothetical protein [Allomuricauda oceani]MDF0708814.1 hypothetical protein [[Muricauda] okinawensis]QII43584.1 hypothetical protein GVT53_02420 [Allomuricauda oceani]
MDREEAYWTREEQELFESCLLDQMTPAEKAGFESRMASDPTLKAKFLEFKALFGAIEEAGLRLAMDHFHEGVQDDGKERRLSTASRTVYRMAAAIAVLMTLGGIWYFYYPNDNERLFAAYYTPDPGLPTVMGNSDNYMFYEAMVDYKQEDYGTALQKWKGLLPGKMDNDTLNYFMGSAHLAKGEADKAISYFDRVLVHDSTPFRSEAAFYKGLAHLKMNEVREALKSLEHTSDDRARELAQKLKD